MTSASSSSSALRRRRPFIPLIPCSNCRSMVKCAVSGTPEHTGWTYFKCQQHGQGCNFWHWELEYVGYLVQNNFLFGDDAVDAIGWAEERREELVLRQAEREAARDGGAGAKQMKMMNTTVALVNAVKEVLLLLKIGVFLVGFLCVLCVLVLLKK